MIKNSVGKNKNKSNFEFIIEKMKNKTPEESETFIYSVLEELCKINEIDQKICPICGENSDFFLPYGVNPRKNAQCPYCFSLERHRLIYLFLEYTHLIKNNTKLLYITPEYSLDNYFKSLNNLKYFSTDIHNGSYSNEKIDLKKDYFDVIIVSNPKIFMKTKYCKSMFNLLKNDGYMIFLENETLKINSNINYLKKAGFKIDKIKSTSICKDNSSFRKYSLDETNIIICKKNKKNVKL